MWTFLPYWVPTGKGRNGPMLPVRCASDEWPLFAQSTRCGWRPWTPQGGKPTLWLSPGKARLPAHLRHSRSRPATTALRRNRAWCLRLFETGGILVCTGATVVNEPAWKAVNRAHWDELVAVHLSPRGYDLTSLREGRRRLNAIEEAELWPVDGQYILHLQCHFGADTLTLAQRGATVVGLDFLPSAILAARRLADELGLADRARFVQADLYDAPTAIPEPAAFDMVFVTWGAIGWLPDIRRWAEIVAHFLKPGGLLYLAEAHPAALVFDDAASLSDGRPGFLVPYFSRAPVVLDVAHDYVDETATLVFHEIDAQVGRTDPRPSGGSLPAERGDATARCRREYHPHPKRRPGKISCRRVAPGEPPAEGARV